jgi:hypothetical protein
MINIKFLARKFLKCIISVRSTLFWERERSGSASGSVLVTNGPVCGSGRPKNIRILRIRSRMLIQIRNNYGWINIFYGTTFLKNL